MCDRSMPRPDRSLSENRMNPVTLALAALTLTHALIASLAVRRLRRHHATALHTARVDPATD
jgi:hypothetical protein